MALPGIDVSYAQGTVDWHSIAASGSAFGFAKVTEGLSITDAQFIPNWKGMAAAGLYRGAYHFFRPADNAAAQAAHFIAQLTAANGGSAMLNPGDLPCVLDAEIVPATGTAPGAYCTAIQTWLEAVEAATGRTPIIYTGRPFWTTVTGGSSAFAHHPLWLAEYGPVAHPPTAWPNYTFWQFTDRKPSPGLLKGSSDGNTFLGTPNDLQTLAGGPVATLLATT